MTKFAIERSWVSASGDSPLEATFARLRIIIADTNVTEFSGEHTTTSDALEIPAYYFAEWIAENWWSLLCEPRKSEDAGDDDNDFLARHSPIAAQHGFALPQLLIVPNGSMVGVGSSARNVQFADVRFRNSRHVFLPRLSVENELRKFVQGCVARLIERNHSNTDLQLAWQRVEETDAEEAEYCRLIGALGLSPYAKNESISAWLDRAAEIFSGDALRDLCLASKPDTFAASVKLAEQARKLVETAPPVSLAPLSATQVPVDNMVGPAWRSGVEAARRVRQALGIRDSDSRGSAKFFDILGIELDPNSTSPIRDTEISPSTNSISNWDYEGQPIVGAVETIELSSRIALLQTTPHKRRFTAARAAYMAWISKDRCCSRLLTMAVTRDQQASRAFAAEMTAPFAYIRSQSTRSTLTQEDIYALANGLSISPDVVRKQALNNGLKIKRWS